MKLLEVICFILLGTVIVSACGGPTSEKKRNNDGEEAGYDLGNRPFVNDPSAQEHHFFFNLVDSHATDSSIVYTALSLYKEDTLGFDVEVLKNIPAGITAEGTPDEENGFRVGSLKFIGIGHVSDNFVKALQDIYQMEGTGEMRRDTIQPLVFSSNKEPVDLSRKSGASTYSFKIFFENKLGPEAEMFAVLDLYRKSFELTEKDATFRANFLSAFTGL